MELLILVGFSIVLVIAFLLGYKFFKSSACYVIGIGGVVSANVYNIGNYSVTVGGIVFGIDSIIYTVAIFCIAIMLVDFNKKEAMALTYTYMASIFLTAVTDLTIKWVTVGFGQEIVWGFYSYCASIIATFLAIKIAIWFYDLTEKKLPIALDLAQFIIIASIINSLIYFGLIAIIGSDFNAFIISLLGSYIGKLFTLLIFVCLYSIFRKNLWSKQLKNKTKNSNID